MASYKIMNAPPMSNLNDFKAAFGRNINPAKSARFIVQIGKISNLFQNLVFMCHEAELPSRSLNTMDVRYYGPNMKMPNQSVYTDTRLVFYVNNNMMEKEIFDNWLSFINPKNTYNFRYREEYSTDISIYQLSEVADPNGKPQATYKATLRQAYPIQVEPLNLSWEEDNIHKMGVSFAYTDWVTVPEAQERSDRQSTLSPFKPL